MLDDLIGVEPCLGERIEHELDRGEFARAVRGEHHRLSGDRRMGAELDESGIGKLAQPVLPLAGRRGHRGQTTQAELIEQRLHELALVAEVPVDRRGVDPQVGAERLCGEPDGS